MKNYLLVIVATFCCVVAEAQCVMCKASVELQDGEQNIGGGINEGILYLMPIPYILMGVIGGIFYFKYKKRQKLNEQ